MIGRVFLGRYEVVSALGQGGMGQIFLAKHRSTNRQVVLKVMHERIAQQPQFRELFRREMECLTRFQHPYAVAFLDASLMDPQGPCLVMEYIRGVDFDRLLQRHRRFPPERIGRLIGQLCEVLQAAHAQGIIHRDLKPANLMVTGWDSALERLKVMDFGLAQLDAGPAPRSAPAGGMMQITLTGTPEYVSPEQASGRKLDGRSDLYSVGVILYEMLTGRRPFNKANPTALAVAHINEVPATFAAAGAPGVVSPAIEAVVQSCLAKDPGRRPTTAIDLAQRFERALGKPILDAQALAPTPAANATPAPATIGGIALRRTMLLAKTASDGKPLSRKTHLDTKPAAEETNGAEFQIDAPMLLPETLDKLNRFAQKLGGKVVDLTPDQMRVLLGKDCRLPTAGGVNGFLPALTEMELHVERKNPKLGTQHVVTLRLSPLGGTTPPPAWRSCCDQIHTELKKFLAGATAQTPG